MRYWILLFLTVQAFAEPTLVATGRIPANQLDATGQDTLGGYFSAMAVDAKSWVCSNNVCAGRLYGLADRGYGDGTNDYRPRIQEFHCTIDLTARRATLTNTATVLLTQTNSLNFSGLISPPAGRQRLDPEGLVRLENGDSYICEEYGPGLLHFDGAGRVIEQLPVPSIYTQRRDNRGFEGLTLTPTGNRKLVAMMQSPLLCDGGGDNDSVNTRILVFGPEGAVAEYVYQLHLTARGKHTPISEILALDETRFLVIERDNGGLGGSGPPVYKRINLADISDATNILHTPHHEHLPKSDLPADVKPVRKSDFIDLLKAGLRPEEFPEKWEGLALVPLPGSSDALLLVGTDNDFKAPSVIHNGVKVGESSTVVDTLLLVYRITVNPASRDSK